MHHTSNALLHDLVNDNDISQGSVENCWSNFGSCGRQETIRITARQIQQKISYYKQISTLQSEIHNRILNDMYNVTTSPMCRPTQHSLVALVQLSTSIQHQHDIITRK